jgi:hypothetical protein
VNPSSPRVERAQPLAEGGDRGLIGDVDRLDADPRLALVGARQFLLVAAGGDDVRAGVAGGEGNGAGDPVTRPMTSTVWSFSDPSKAASFLVGGRRSAPPCRPR